MLKSTIISKTDLHSSLDQSAYEIKKIQQQEYWHYVQTMAAFYIFILVCIYIINKRLPILTLLYRVVSYVLSKLLGLFGK